MDCSPPGSSVSGDSPVGNTRVGCHALRWGIFPTRGLNPRSVPLQADSLSSEPPGKPKNTGVGSLSLFQGVFSNPGILLWSPVLKADFLPAELPGKPLLDFNIIPL